MQRAETLETTSQSMVETADQLQLRIQSLPEELNTVVRTGNTTGLETQINEMTTEMSQLMQKLDNARAQIQEQNAQIAGLKAPAPDEATGAASREEFAAVMAQLQKDGATVEEPLSLILLEAGNYHQLLREEGPEVADQQLRLLAECAAGNIASQDQIGRYRDDTLAILLPGRGSADVLRLGNLMTEAAGRILKSTSATRPRVSIVTARSSESPSELIKRAEAGIARDANEKVDRVALTESVC